MNLLRSWLLTKNKKFQNRCFINIVMSDMKKWLVEWFTTKTNIDESEIVEKTSQDYFSQKWIDSLKFFGLITEVENEFGIMFSNDDFQDRKFANIDGLSEIIEEKINAK